MEFINIFNKDTQFEILKTIKESKTPFTLWQFDEDERKVFRFKNLRLCKHSKHIEIDIKNDTHLFSSRLPIYFYCKHRTSIFKSSIIFNSNFKIITEWPLNFMINNQRENERIQSNHNKTLIFKLLINNTVEKEFVKYIIDESSCGVSVRVPLNEINYFSEKSVVRFIYKDKLRMGIVRYISPMRDPTYRNHFRIGLSF